MKKQVIQLLDNLFRNRQFFDLHDELAKYAGDKSTALLFYQGAVANKFNRMQLSVDLLEEYIKTAQPKGEKLVDCYELLGDNYAKSFQYRRAAEMFALALECFGNELGEDKKQNIRYLYDLWSAARRVPPQKTSFDADTHLRATRGKVPLLHIPIEINGQMIEFVFDCGADVSSISASNAAILGLQIIEAKISVAGASCRSFAKLAVAPLIKAGHVIFRNVVLLVLEDRDFYIEKHDYQINGVFGYLAIAACRQITINRKDEIFIPARAVRRTAEQNLLIDEMKPILKLAVKNRRMTFFFDSGALKTKFFPKCLESREIEIKKPGKPQSGSLSGAGGSRDYPAYVAAELSFPAFGKILRFKKPVIFTVPALYQSEYHYGNIGQDWIAQFEKTTFDFTAMSIIFE
jgi:hypothetical protein